MLSDPVIKAFHAHDTCCLTSDRYLLAMVFVYFKKAKLEHEEYNRLNFFKALYLAHEMEEENDENRWEILPWALGRRWQGTVFRFLKSSSISFIICNNDDLMFEFDLTYLIVQE